MRITRSRSSTAYHRLWNRDMAAALNLRHILNGLRSKVVIATGNQDLALRMPQVQSDASVSSGASLVVLVVLVTLLLLASFFWCICGTCVGRQIIREMLWDGAKEAKEQVRERAESIATAARSRSDSAESEVWAQEDMELGLLSTIPEVDEDVKGGWGSEDE
ncbi:MAG: hypothetical protein DHS80DRAFT_31128 [Piptocephalis tieghemiana]|nr:MAG: hypothetical protein DHS80DRAFT_31128 [Piptocephalis tieghemiana]